MSIKILGAGFGRTGTNSLKVALEILGLGPCYHMFETGKNPVHIHIWNKAICGEAVDWNKLYSGYQSAVDWPTISFIPQLLEAFPRAKVILTRRDSEEWYESARNTIFEAMLSGDKNPDLEGRARTKMSRKLIIENTFSGRYDDKKHCIEVYDRHIQNIRELVNPNDLLEYNINDGWEVLCDFLNVPVPINSFPSTNDRKSFLAMRPEWAK